MPRIAGEIRLREQIGEVYGDVGRCGGRPTISQLDRTAVLDQDVEKAGQSLDAITAGLDSLNERQIADRCEGSVLTANSGRQVDIVAESEHARLGRDGFRQRRLFASRRVRSPSRAARLPRPASLSECGRWARD